MARSESRLIRSRHAVFVGLLIVLLAGAFAILRDFTIDNSVGIWFAQDDPALVEYEAYLQEFGHTEWTLLMVETASIEDPGFLEELAELSSALAEVDHVQRVVSLVDLPGGTGQPEELVRRLEECPFAVDLLIRQGDNRHTVLLLATDDYPTRQDPYRMALVDRIHEVVEGYATVIDHSLAGTSVINAELNRSARADMFVFFTLVTVLVFALSLVLFRSVRDALVLLTVAAGTVVITMGLLAACGYSLNMVTLMLPTVLIALSVADAVHVISTFHQVRPDVGAERAVGNTIRQVWLPCLGTTVTTIVGFLSLSVSSVLPIFQLAVFGAFGIAMAYVISLTVAPLLLYELWPDTRPPRRPRVGGPRSVRALVDLLDRRPAALVLVFALSTAGLAGLWLLDADTNYAEFFRTGSTVPSDYARIDEVGFAQNPLVLTLEAAPGGSLLGPESWQSLGALGQELRQLPEIEYVLSPVTVAEAFGLDGSPPAGASGLPDPVGLVSRGGQLTQLVLLTDYMSSDDLHRLMAEVHRVKARSAPAGSELRITGTTVLWATMDTQIIRTQVGSALIVSIALLLVLTAVFRSLSLALVGWVVSAFPVALILGVMGFLGVQINMATVLIAGIALGIAVDDTIHLTFAFRDRLQRGLDLGDAMEQALLEIGPRLVLTSLILMGGFGTMVVSSFLPTANFGLFSCLTIFVALVCDLFFLPILLRTWGRLATRAVPGASRRSA